MLRVDSPGGSVFGSELVRRELELTRAAGKPVVVSMGDVAASGGYWISTASDEVIADAGTVTGSIGVFGLLPSVDQALDKLGIHTGGVDDDLAARRRRPARCRSTRASPQVVQTERRPHLCRLHGQVAPARKTTPREDRRGRPGPGLDRRAGQGARSGRPPRQLRATRCSRRRRAPSSSTGYRVAYIEREPGTLSRGSLELFNGVAAAGSARRSTSNSTAARAARRAAAVARGAGRDSAGSPSSAEPRQPFARSPTASAACPELAPTAACARASR